MKKILSSFIIMVMIILVGGFSYAETEPNIELNLTGNTTINQGETLTLILSLGNFSGIEENAMIGYEAILDYDEDVFESVSVNGLNGWEVNYSETTKRIVADPKVGKPNTQITELVFKLKEGVKSETTPIKFNKIILSDPTNDFNYTKEVTITIKENEQPTPATPEDTTTPTEQQTPTISETKGETSTTQTPSKKTDTTVAKTQLPKAGIRNIVLIIVAIVMIAIVSIIRYKSIEIK